VDIVDEVVDRPLIDWLEGDFLHHPGRDDPPCLLPHRSLLPTRVLPLVGAHVESVVDRDGPNPRGGAVRHPVLAGRCDGRESEVIGLKLSSSCFAMSWPPGDAIGVQDKPLRSWGGASKRAPSMGNWREHHHD
jgi:hypothetical protein